MTAPITETRRTRGQTRAIDMLRRSAAHDRARTCLTRLMSDLDGQEGEFVVEVLRAVVRAIGSALVQRAGVARAVGVFVGVLTNISPAWRSDVEAARAEADSIFGRAA